MFIFENSLYIYIYIYIYMFKQYNIMINNKSIDRQGIYFQINRIKFFEYI